MKKLIFLSLITFAILSCNNNSSETPTPVDTTVVTPVDTTVVTVNYYGLRRFDGSEGSTTKYYTTVQLSSGQCFCGAGGYKYISTGKISDIDGLTQLDGTSMVNCSDASPCKQ